MKFGNILNYIVIAFAGLLVGWLLSAPVSYMSVTTIVAVIVSLLPILAAIRHYFQQILDKYVEEIAWRKTIDDKCAEEIVWRKTLNDTLDRYERRLHWTDIGFEVLFEGQRKLIASSKLSDEEKEKFEEKITKLVMSRISSDNPAYKTTPELKNYLIEWASSHK